MNNRLGLPLLVLAATLCGSFSCAAQAAGGTLAAEVAQLRKEVRRARDVAEVQNLMSRRAFYHSIGRNERELALWTRKRADEAVWAQNQGCYVGMKSIEVGYKYVNIKRQDDELEKLSKLHPDTIKNVADSRFVGNTVLHLLTTPIIEIADDGMSAKAVWYTPGAIMNPGDGNTPEGFWIWERYGVDFIREDGHWAFLHIQVNTDFMQGFGAPLKNGDAAAAAIGAEGGGGVTSSIMPPGPDIQKTLYKEYSISRVPSLAPRLPEPYKTLSQTFQYGDCGQAMGK